MKLTYSILWFDNSEEFFDSLDCSALEQAITSWGFTPKIIFETSPKAFMGHSPFSNLDLIVVDYDLGEDAEHGETFIRNVRDNNVLTEIVFYSNNASRELWRAIADKELEGVYVANRREVLARIERVGRQSVQKILDLNNMRGLVMAEVGDIDLILDELITVGWGALNPDAQEDIVSRFRVKAIEQVDRSRTALASLTASSEISDILDACDSNKRWQNFVRLRRHIPELKACEPGDYVADILAPRNYLAHGQAREDGAAYIFTFRGKEYRFDEAEGVRLRGRIGEYKSTLQAGLAAMVTKMETNEQAQENPRSVSEAFLGSLVDIPTES